MIIAKKGLITPSIWLTNPFDILTFLKEVYSNLCFGWDNFSVTVVPSSKIEEIWIS